MPILPGFFLSKPKPVGSGTIQIKSRVPWLPCTCIRPSLIGHSNKNNSAYKPSTTAEAPDGVLVVVLGEDKDVSLEKEVYMALFQPLLKDCKCHKKH